MVNAPAPDQNEVAGPELGLQVIRGILDVVETPYLVRWHPSRHGGSRAMLAIVAEKQGGVGDLRGGSPIITQAGARLLG
jgi:hypothetical protein